MSCFVICAGAVLHVFAYWSDVSARTKQRCDSLILDHSAPRCYFTITCTLSQCKHINILKEQFTRVRKPSTHVTWFWIWRTFFLQCNIKAAECPSCSFPYNETCQRSVKSTWNVLNKIQYIYIYIYIYVCIYTYTHSLPTLLGTHLFNCLVTQITNQPITWQHLDVVKTTCWSSNPSIRTGKKGI